MPRPQRGPTPGSGKGPVGKRPQPSRGRQPRVPDANWRGGRGSSGGSGGGGNTGGGSSGSSSGGNCKMAIAVPAVATAVIGILIGVIRKG